MRIPHIAFLVIITQLLSCNNNEDNNKIIHVSEEGIIIDGKSDDMDWNKANWQKINQNWLGPEYSDIDFKGRFKLLWDKNYIYVIAEITDDKLVDKQSNGLVNYWDDDCLEIFIDSDASGGNHQYNYNAFAYHISLDNKVVDIGIDSLPNYYDHIESVRLTNGNFSTWELAISIYDDTFKYFGENTKLKLAEKGQIGFAIAYCDNDNSEERENFIGSSVVFGDDKNRGWIDADIFDKYQLLK